MKLKLKHAVTVLLSFMMIINLAIPVMADTPKGTITVKKEGYEFAEKDITAVKIFDAEVVIEQDNSKTVKYILRPEFEDFFLDEKGCTQAKGTTQLSTEAYGLVFALTDENLDKFAADILKWYKANAGNYTFKTKTAEAVQIDGEGIATLSDLEYGYYLVFPEGGSTSLTRHTDAMLINLLDTSANAKLKSEYPTIDKEIVDGSGTADAVTANIGDVITFQLTSTVPDMTGYTNYHFNFIDTLSKGLTLDKDSVEVYIDGVKLTKGPDYSVSDTNNSDGTTTLEVFMQSLTDHRDYAGKTLTVKYNATLNENAVMCMDKNTNKAKVEYSNDPNGTSKGESKEDETEVHTFEIEIEKYAGDYASSLHLANAKFKLCKNAAGTDIIELVLVNAGDANTPAAYRTKKDGETATAEIVTSANGYIRIYGLDEGTYYLIETDAPVGYNKLEYPIEIVITAAYKDPTSKDELEDFSVEYTYDGTTVNVLDKKTIPVKNNSGAILPDTGGMGTTIFTIAGVLLIIGGVIWFVMWKKKNNEEK